MLRATSVRVLDDRDVEAVRQVLARDPIANVFVTSRVEAAGLDPWRLGAEIWGYSEGRQLEAVCYSGANLVPVNAHADAARAFADKARRQGRRCSSIVGPADAVDEMWSVLHRAWGPARDVRPDQPLMATSRPSAVPPDPLVRRVEPHEFDVVLPACIAMFTEEVGISPLAGDGGDLYRRRVAELIAQRRAFARIESGRVTFKAEIGALSSQACQVQGVWVDPELRGQGYGTIGTAAVVDDALRTLAPVVSLYVNEYNVPARRAYERIGFTEVGRFMSVLF